MRPTTALVGVDAPAGASVAAARAPATRRAGPATSAAAAGVEERTIARQTGHRSMAVLRGSIREGELFRHNAAAALL